MKSIEYYDIPCDLRELDAKEVRNIQLKILESVCDFCKANGITIFLMYGSLLGAIREHGFIPWDDDIDLCMTRKDYERFIDIFPKAQNELIVRDQATEKDFPFFFAKICMPDTYLYEVIDGKSFNIGINVDLFPLDNVPDDIKLKKKMYRKINSVRRKVIPATIDRTLKRPIHKQIILKTMDLMYNKPVSYYYKQLNDVVAKYRDYQSSNVTEIMTPYGERAILDRTLFDKAILVEFENIVVPVPEKYDEILKKIYGNYMQRPPKDKQVTHHTFKAFIKEGDTK